MKKILLTLIYILHLGFSYSQALVPDIFTPNNTILCNDTAVIIMGNVGGGEDFNCGGPCLSGWQDGGGAQYDNPYISSPTNDSYLWMGPLSTQPRTVTSPPFNASNGGNVCFDFVYPPQNLGSPTEGPDQSDEGITFQYSIDGGLTWIDIVYFMPNGQQLPTNPGAGFPMTTPPFNNAATPYTVWNSVCFPIPVGAQTTNTMFQWFQLTGSTANFDHWGLDNIFVSLSSDPMLISMTGGGSWVGNNPDTLYIEDVFQETDYYFSIIDTGSMPPIVYYDTVTIYVEATDAGPDVEVSCSTLGIELGVTGIMPFSNVTWTPPTGLSDSNIQNPYANPIDDQMYTVTSDCGVDSVFVNVVPIFIPNITAIDSICANDSTVLFASTDNPLVTYTYEWTQFVQNDTNQSATVFPTINTTYYLEIVSDSGCVRNDSIDIFVGAVPKTILYNGEMRVCRGDSTQIIATAIQPTFFDDFDASTGANMSIWADIQNGTANNDCGSYSGASALHFNGTGNRWAQLQNVDATLGGDISFWLIYGSAFGISPCSNMGFFDIMQLEYSTDNGITWTTINTYASNDYDNFTLVQENIPALAQTANTIFRFNQPSNGGTNADNWAIDDFLLELNCSGTGCVNYTYAWSPTSTVSDPTSTSPYFFPNVTTTYSLLISPEGFNCNAATDEITIEVDEMDLHITPSDTFLCEPAQVLLESNVSTDCEFTLDMHDSYGDGWNGNEISVFADGTLVGTYSVHSFWTGGNGNDELVTFSVASGQTITFVYTTGSYQSEVSFEIYDNNGTQIFSETTGLPNLPNGLFFTTTANCIGAIAWSPNYMISNTTIINPLVNPQVSTDYVISVYNENNCLFTDTAEVEIFENISLTPNTSICAGSTLQLNASGADSYVWSPNIDLDNTTISDPITSTSSDITYYVTYTEQTCVAVDSVEIDVMPLPQLEINSGTSPINYCEGDDIDLMVDNLIGWTYSWSPGTENSATYNVSTEGNYTVVYNNGDCENSSTVNVIENPLPEFDFSSFDQILCCEDDETTVNFSVVVSNVTIQDVYWNGILNTNSSETIYSAEDNYIESNIIKVLSDKGCENERNVPEVTTKCANPSFTNPDTIFINTSVIFELNAEDTESDATSYTWTTTDNSNNAITDASIEDATFNGVEEGVFTANVTVTNTYGNKTCIETAEANDYEVVELKDPQYPDAFTPNGDEINNVFKPVINDFAEITEFRIYNRWGKLVYDMATAKNKDGWDGAYKGIAQKQDLYMYYITVKHPDKTFVQEGAVSLLR